LAQAFKQVAGRTVVPLDFEPYGSMFVIFRTPILATAAGNGTVNFPTPVVVQELRGPWAVSFEPKWGGPAKPVTFESLQDWTTRPETGIRFYSGTATYRQTFSVKMPQNGHDRVFLDLGTVKEMASVRLNGKDLGVVWCPPWRVDITDTLKAEDNVLEIDVVNNWPNRLIGDGNLPPEKRFTKTNVSAFYNPPKKGGVHDLLPSGLHGPVTVSIGAQ
jgi:hypothetical protein